MKGRAHQIIEQFRRENGGGAGAFRLARLIIESGINPNHITPELDDQGLEERLEQAVRAVSVSPQSRTRASV